MMRKITRFERKIVMNNTKNHIKNCCVLHGCSFNEIDCPVANHKATQEDICEKCKTAGIKNLEQVREELDSHTMLGYIRDVKNRTARRSEPAVNKIMKYLIDVDVPNSSDVFKPKTEDELGFIVGDTFGLLCELLENPQHAHMMQKIIRLTGRTLNELADLAVEIDDERLHRIMLKLGLYGCANPVSPEYNPIFALKFIKGDFGSQKFNELNKRTQKSHMKFVFNESPDMPDLWRIEKSRTRTALTEQTNIIHQGLAALLPYYMLKLAALFFGVMLPIQTMASKKAIGKAE